MEVGYAERCDGCVGLFTTAWFEPSINLLRAGSASLVPGRRLRGSSNALDMLLQTSPRAGGDASGSAAELSFSGLLPVCGPSPVAGVLRPPSPRPPAYRAAASPPISASPARPVQSAFAGTFSPHTWCSPWLPMSRTRLHRIQRESDDAQPRKKTCQCDPAATCQHRETHALSILSPPAGSALRLGGSYGSTGSLSSSMDALHLLVTDLSRRNRHEHGSTAALVSMSCGLLALCSC